MYMIFLELQEESLATSRSKPEPHEVLPLRPVEFQILLSLSQGIRHGYAIMREAVERTGGEVAPEIGTLYRALARMKEAGLIADADRRPAPEADDARRNYYRITSRGTDVARAEAERLETLVRAARASGVLGESEAR